MEEQQQNKKSRKGLKRAIRWIITLLSVVVLLEASYFLLGYFIKKNISEEVFERSQGVYSVKYSHFEMLFWEMGFQLTGFELNPNIELYKEKLKKGEIKTSLYQISIPYCKLSGLNFELFFQPGLELSELTFDKPVVRVLAFTDSTTSGGPPQYDDIGPIVQNLMQYLIIDKVNIEEGIFDLFLDQEDRVESFTASKITLNLEGFNGG